LGRIFQANVLSAAASGSAASLVALRQFGTVPGADGIKLNGSLSGPTEFLGLLWTASPPLGVNAASLGDHQFDPVGTRPVFAS
jgi:hypothetical protein